MNPGGFLFKDRLDAGAQLAFRLTHLKNTPTVVLGIPRGGIPVACEVARQLGLALGIELVKKIGHPDNPEYAIGSVSTEGMYLQPQAESVDKAYIQQESERIRRQLRDRQLILTGTTHAMDIRNRPVLLIDDGVATGSTLIEAIRDLRERGAAHVSVAVPVGPPGTSQRFSSRCDAFTCLYEPGDFSSVGQYYADFSPVEDAEAANSLRAFSHLT